MRCPPIPAYDKPNSTAKKFELEGPAPILDEEDEETLAAIGEGIREAEAGRVVPAEKARELLPKWTAVLIYTQKALNNLAELIRRIAEGDAEAASDFRNMEFNISS